MKRIGKTHNGIQPYKGVRDFYPEDERVQNHIFGAMRRAAERYGYEEMNASILEPTELYLSKTSEEIINEQSYTFTDRGDRSVTLRPEMTPTVARMVGTRRRELGFPLRWYSIQNFFRYERPQKGRVREFWQLNADLFGAPELEADIEVISLAHRIMDELDAPESAYSIRIGSRAVLEAALGAAGLSGDGAKAYRKILDAKRKTGEKGYKDAVATLTKSDPLSIIASRSDAKVATAMASVDVVIARLEKSGITNAVHDPGIVRGLDYYTDIVFEVFDTNPENPRALAGGGRYDKLIESYGYEALPAVGFAMGDVTIRDFLETHKLLPTLAPSADLYLAPVTEADSAGAAAAADVMRARGANVALGMSTRPGKHGKVADHIKTASKLGISSFAAYGEKESASGNLAVKDLATGDEKIVSIEDAALLVKRDKKR